MLRTLLKPALTGPLDRVHLAGYHAGALDGVPAEWRALSEHTLNEGQEQTLELVARGGNVLSRQPTGSGKSYCYLLPALAKWAAVARARSACADESTRTKLPLPPLVMVVAPFRELGKDAERQATFLLERLYTDGLLPTVDVLGQPARARALFGACRQDERQAFTLADRCITARGGAAVSVVGGGVSVTAAVLGCEACLLAHVSGQCECF